MRKDKSGERFGTGGKNFTPRHHSSFDIGPNSSPRKVARWLARGGGSPIARTPAQMAKAHIHPRSKRA